MKYEINLLPPEALSLRASSLLHRRQSMLFWGAVMACTVVMLSYAAIWISLRSLRQSFTDQIVSQNKDRSAIVQRNKELNADIVSIDARVASYALWTVRIPDVVAAAPAGVKISRIELIESSDTLVITGVASQGSYAVEYQASLERLPWVDHVVAPLQNFARSPEATVTFTVFHKKPFSL